MHIVGYSNSQRVIYFALLIQFELIFPTDLSSSSATNVEIEQCKMRSDNNDFEVIEVYAGENANVQCELNEGRGNGSQQLMWFSAKGNETPTFISLDENSRRYSKSNDGSNLVHLVILNFTELDQGCYQCQILFRNSNGKSDKHKLTKFIKVKQKPPIQPSTTKTEEPMTRVTNPPLQFPTISPSTTNKSTEYYREYFPQMPLLFVCIALLTLVDILLACLVIKWCNDRKRRNDTADVESLQNDSLSISTALDGTMLPSPSDYKPFMQPSHTNNGAPAHPAYIVKVPIHSQRISNAFERRRRYSQDLDIMETIYENLEQEIE